MKAIPTTEELYNLAVADIEHEFDVTVPTEGKNFWRALATVLAAAYRRQYVALGQVQKNIFIDSADPESMGGTLDRFGRVKLGRSPFAATQGLYTVQVTGDVSSVIPAGAIAVSDDDSQSPGYSFILDSPHTMASTTDTITLRCLHAGTEALLQVGDTLTFTQPINNVDESAEVTAVSSTPQAAENIEVYRAAGLLSYRLEPQGGAASDYRIWASDAQGVVASYPYAKDGEPWVIELYVEGDPDTYTNGVPDSGLLDDVADVVDLDPDTTLPLSERGRRPLQVEMDVKAVDALAVAITITGLVDSTAAKQATIESAMEELMGNVRPFIAGADVAADRNDTLSLNSIITAIQTALPGQEFTSVSMTVDAVSQTSYEFDNGEIPYLDSVTFS